MKFSKKLKFFLQGATDCRRNYYQPPVDEKERLEYNKGWDYIMFDFTTSVWDDIIVY